MSPPSPSGSFVLSPSPLFCTDSCSAAATVAAANRAAADERAEPHIKDDPDEDRSTKACFIDSAAAAAMVATSETPSEATGSSCASCIGEAAAAAAAAEFRCFRCCASGVRGRAYNGSSDWMLDREAFGEAGTRATESRAGEKILPPPPARGDGTRATEGTTAAEAGAVGGGARKPNDASAASRRWPCRATRASRPETGNEARAASSSTSRTSSQLKPQWATRRASSAEASQGRPVQQEIGPQKRRHVCACGVRISQARFAART